MHPLIRDVLLRDGTTLRLRQATPEDYEEIKLFYDRLSPESRYLRFHGAGRTDAAARRHAEADGVDRVSLIARHGGRVVAVAGYERLREPHAAEVAFAVAEDFRARGTATRMLEQLAQIAAERGIRRFDAYVLASNRPMLGVFAQAGFAVRRRSAEGEVTVSLDITPSEAVLERIDERTHAAAIASLRPLLHPASVAVVGEQGRIGAGVVEQIVRGGYTGTLTVVGPAGEHRAGVATAVSLAELQPAPELVVTAVPACRLPEVAAEAARVGVRALLALTADTVEADRDVDRERLLESVRAAGMRLIGPSSLGIVNTDPGVSLRATFASAPAAAGGLAVCSQSGAIGISLLGHAAARGFGISTFVSLGERYDVSTNDLLEFWQEDGRTAAVLLYLETFGNPERFARLARRVSRAKPVLAIKGNRPPARRPADAQSHTAAALRGDAAVDAMLHHAGVMRFAAGDALFNAAEFFVSQPLPGGPRVGIVSNSSGVATLTADACATRGLVVEPPAGPEATANPWTVPINASAERYQQAVATLLADPAIDAVIACFVELTAGAPEAVLAAVGRAAGATAKPAVASVVGSDGQLPVAAGSERSDGRAARGVPNFRLPESCADVLARGVQRRRWLSRPLGQRPRQPAPDSGSARELVRSALSRAPGEPSRWLTTAEAEPLLGTYGVRVSPTRACADPEEAVAAARALEGAAVLKAAFPPPAHASDIDAVLIGLEGDEAISAGWRELQRRVQAAGWRWQGALVQPLEGPGADLLVGAVRDPDYGPVVALGLGGRQAGLGGGVAARLPPVTDVDAEELIDAALGVRDLLEAFRDQPPLDRGALRDLVLSFAALVREVPAILEVDLNPTRCMREGCVVLDARVRVGEFRAAERIKTW